MEKYGYFWPPCLCFLLVKKIGTFFPVSLSVPSPARSSSQQIPLARLSFLEVLFEFVNTCSYAEKLSKFYCNLDKKHCLKYFISVCVKSQLCAGGKSILWIIVKASIVFIASRAELTLLFFFFFCKCYRLHKRQGNL